ncbi:MAG: homocysteine S-methyltransferase family protein, partial [Planctomycetota bacterium]
MRTRHSLLQTLDQRVLVLDGATGTGLMARRPDLDPAQGLEGLNVSDPDLVLSLHAEHLRAGCDLVRTNSFCASEPECAAVGRAGWARRLSRRAAELAREAAGDEAFVLGVLGPGRGHASDGERVE